MTKNFDLLIEAVLKRMGPTDIKDVDGNNVDISNFIYKNTDGGRELFTIFTIRKNDSKSDPSKKAGMEMRVTGKYGSCKASRDSSDTRVPELSTVVQYAKNNILRMCVSSVDGEDYTKVYSPAQRTRSFDVTQITKIEAGNEIYEIL